MDPAEPGGAFADRCAPGVFAELPRDGGDLVAAASALNVQILTPATHIQTTVVIPAYQAWETLPRVLDALGPQLTAHHEAILVDSSPDAPARAKAAMKQWPWLQVLPLDQRTPPGRARNIGAEHANGAGLAFLDADAIPEPAWLEKLEAALRPELDAVAGAVANGTSGSRIGTAGYLLEFSEWLPERATAVSHAAGCNLLFRRQTYLKSGGMPEDMWQGEDTAATIPLHLARRLGFAPHARVLHLNKSHLKDFVRHQRQQGAAYRELCERGIVKHPFFTRCLFGPLAFPLRLGALTSRVAPHAGPAWQALRSLPWILVGLAAWCGGLCDRSGSMSSSFIRQELGERT